jgi:hypothetical protein
MPSSKARTSGESSERVKIVTSNEMTPARTRGTNIARRSCPASNPRSQSASRRRAPWPSSRMSRSRLGSPTGELREFANHVNVQTNSILEITSLGNSRRDGIHDLRIDSTECFSRSWILIVSFSLSRDREWQSRSRLFEWKKLFTL